MTNNSSLCLWAVVSVLLCHSSLSDETFEEWTHRLGWSDPNPCKWAHVQCNSQNRVTRIQIGNQNLRATLPPELKNLNSLQRFEVMRNHLSGPLPSLAGLSSLQVGGETLNPTEFLLRMQGLSLSNNHFDGHIPQEFCQIADLLFLDLSDNNLSGPIPSCFISNSSDTRHVYLNKNILSGPLPPAFCYNTSLVTLDLSDNNFTGNIPSCLSTSQSLSFLLLRDNWFSGIIPILLCRLNWLSLLDLSGNDLSGPIPPCFSNIAFQATDLKTVVPNLVDSMYHIKSELAFTYMSMTKLEGRDNSFVSSSGETNAYFFVCTDLVEQVEFRTKRRLDSYVRTGLNLMSGIDLSRNKLSGEILSDMGKLGTIYALNLSHNRLTGSIPTTFSELSRIESLDLSYNQLQGGIPSELTVLSFLAIFSVAHNNLSGPVPARTAQFGTFEESSYEGNPLLCGPPLQSSSTQTPVKPNNTAEKEDGEGGWIDTDVFYISFVVTYIAMLLTVAATLCKSSLETCMVSVCGRAYIVLLPAASLSCSVVEMCSFSFNMISK